MSLPTNIAPSAWDSANAKQLRDFLASNTGQLVLEWLGFWQPGLLDGTDVNKTLVASGQVKGYSEALQNLLSLTVEQPQEVSQPTTSDFPSLDDETAWKPEDNVRPL